ncbi:TSP1 domain-containing protein TSP12 related protein [Cyclospora cayetanensis]|uniref:TSP1 domain-containing protein TSP12 related protein n=1 Tax=Cyclospora cayetanensis TaxID=88456 RepID=A0A1D3CT26_9EIME|nr:TSP1 domain-containing protein TSP12 related protein [Cyclospora cayetanensis]
MRALLYPFSFFIESRRVDCGSKLKFSWHFSFAFVLSTAPLLGLYLGILGNAAQDHEYNFVLPSTEQGFQPQESDTSKAFESFVPWRNTLRELDVVGSSEEKSAPWEGENVAAREYSEILEKLSRITRHESSDTTWLNIQLQPYRSGVPGNALGNALATEHASATRMPWRNYSDQAGNPTQEVLFGGSMLELKSSAKLSTSPGTFANKERTKWKIEDLKVRDSESSMQGGTTEANVRGVTAEHEASARNSAEGATAHFTFGTMDKYLEPAGSAVHMPDNNQLLDTMDNDFRVAIDPGSLGSQLDIQYTFPTETHDSKDIAFIVLAIPAGYTIEEKASDTTLCRSADPTMPPLRCSLRLPHDKRKHGGEATFLVVSSADTSRDLPLGKHYFAISTSLPSTKATTEIPQSWFATFRFTGGHAVTKHFEDTRLIARYRCVWSEWKQETPCSTTCNEGYEIWTRMLFAGPSEEHCGGAILKRRCQTEACSLSCQLLGWELLSSCTRNCGAKDGEAFKVSIRRVLIQGAGWGHSCSKLYPWDDITRAGWSERLKAVVSLTPCDDRFKAPCPAQMGCRVEEINSRTMPASFPWGVCPFPCGGFGNITSIVQVANGIPRWLGEKLYPDTFQIPCKADKEPLVTARKCNTQACEDCSVYLENPEFGKATRAWIFFLPTLECDKIDITVPKGMSILSSTLSQQHAEVLRKGRISRLSHILPSPVTSQATNVALYFAEEDLGQKVIGNCSFMANSFGGIKSCKVGASQLYPGSESAQVWARSFIAPSGTHTDASSPDNKKHNNTRPHWMALPVILGEQAAMQDGGNFYLWLTTSSMPRDPEVFTCRLMTYLAMPKQCAFHYTPKDPNECNSCEPDTSQPITSYREFVPAKHGGSCSIPENMRTPGSILTVAPCTLSCGRLPHGSAKIKKEAPNAKKRDKSLSMVKRVALVNFRRMLQSYHLSAASGEKPRRLHTAVLGANTAGAEAHANTGSLPNMKQEEPS